MRKHSVKRKTKETDIEVNLNLDGKGKSTINTGIGFLDHMIDQLSKHSLLDIKIQAKGDLHIDYHHTTEDTALALGDAFNKSLGDKKGIHRFGQALSAMDETLSRVVVDCSNRPYLVWKVKLNKPKFLKTNAVLAVIFGHVQLSNISKYPMVFGGRGMAIAGLVCGYISIGFSVIGLLFLGSLFSLSNELLEFSEYY